MLFEAALESSLFVVELRTLAASCNPGCRRAVLHVLSGSEDKVHPNTISLFGAYVSLTAVEPCIAGSGG